jgi:Cu/Ag efflux protein CusF
MPKLLAPITAVALALAAGAASAAEWTGTIEEIDEVSRNIVVNSSARPDQQMIFAVSDMNTVGATIDDLQEGDTVRVFYAESGTHSGPIVNAMQIDKVSNPGDAAMTGDTAEWEGAVEQVDQTAGTVTVGGQEFALAETAVIGVPLDQLQQGDQVRIVYQDAAGRREVVELTKVE